LPAKGIALLGALVLHALLLGYALRIRGWQAPSSPPEKFVELFWLDGSEAPVEGAAAIRPSRATPRAPTHTSAPVSQTAILSPERFDWGAQAKDAAAAVMQHRAEKERREAPFAPRQPLAGLASKEKLDPGWREYRFRGHGRVETQSGVPILHLNDRCVLVGFVIPACILGKIKPGEMYEHMQEWQRHREEEQLP